MRFNTTQSNKIVNYAGGEAFKESPKLALISQLLTSFVQDQYYRSADDSLEELVNLIDQIKDKKFIAKAAVYARTKFGMRSITHAVAAELAKRVKGERWTKRFYDRIVYRPDDITEIVAYYLNKYNKPLPNSLKRGLGQALTKFDEYQLAKYRAERASVSLVDVVNLVHPKHTEAIAKLVKGTLKSKNTFQVELTKAGKSENKEQAKKKAWTKLIKSRKLGYFALLKNIRNIYEQAPEALDDALSMLTDEKLIKKSLVLPFRFLTAIKEVEKLNGTGVQDILIALNKAVDISITNVPKFDGDTLVVLDTSGSMEGRPAEIGSLFAAILVKNNHADFMTFSDHAEYQTLNPLDSTMTLAKSIKFEFGSTNFHSIFETANRAYQRIIILSDMQGWVGYHNPTQSFNEYKERVGANPIIYSFDLQGYGSLQFPEKNVYALAGFSEKVFDVMKLLESDKQALIKKIKEINL
ncbi:MAG: TROVE domain-containing protein [Cyanobacteria bacterium J149]|nr:MAG: TROVE domain-containing protein [Cyanobacteria bacterium J149]